jgi:hypothetical protein
MKAKTFVACVLTASALPLAPALALGPQPSGPQGTGSYGAPNAAVPVPQVLAPGDPVVVTPLPQDGVNRAASMRGRGMYDGPSWSTSPPAPPA